MMSKLKIINNFSKFSKFPKNNNNFKRERFNSDGNNHVASKFTQQSNYNSAQGKFEEIEIDVTNIKYSLNSIFNI